MKIKKFLAVLSCLTLALSQSSIIMPVISHADTIPGEITTPEVKTKYIPITVKAIDANSQKEVLVENATVELKIDNKVVKSATTNNKGVAYIDASDLSVSEIAHSRVSAYKTIAKSNAITGNARNALFSAYPDNIRATYELHSETLDEHGNWTGKRIPYINNNKVDISFVIDSTGSMQSDIDMIEENIEKLSESLINDGIDARFSIISYRSVNEESIREYESTMNSIKNKLATYKDDWINTGDNKQYVDLVSNMLNVLAYPHYITTNDVDKLDALGENYNYSMFNNNYKELLNDIIHETDNNKKIYLYEKLSPTLKDQILQDYCVYLANNYKTVLLTSNDNVWFNDATDVRKAMSSIYACGGHDKESTLDALGFLANNDMHWRSDAHKVAYLITDEDDTELYNNYGYKSLVDAATDLTKQNIIVNRLDYGFSLYSILNMTNGYRVGSPNTDFMDMSLGGNPIKDTIEELAYGGVTLTLNEPRVKYNMSVSYIESDKEYEDSIKSMMNYCSKDLAQATNGHVMLDKVMLVPVKNTYDFFGKNSIGGMADLQIESMASDWPRLRANSYVDGFFMDDLVDGTEDIVYSFDIPGVDVEGNSAYDKYCRILMSAVEGAGWNNDLKDNTGKTTRNKTHRQEYGETVAHEFGHYGLGFFDEYVDSIESNYNLGLMQNQHYNLELSNKYLYANYNSSFVTRQIQNWNVPTEELLNNRLTFGIYTLGDKVTMVDNSSIKSFFFNANPYKVTYTEAGSKADALNSKATVLYNAEYEEANLSADDFIKYNSSGTIPGSSSNTSNVKVAKSIKSNSAINEESFNISNLSIGKQSMSNVKTNIIDDEHIKLTISNTSIENPVVYLKNIEDDTYIAYDLNSLITESDDMNITENRIVSKNENNEYEVVLPINKEAIYEMMIADNKTDTIYNNYYIDRSNTMSTDKGYYSRSIDNTVEAVLTSDSEQSYVVLTDSSSYNHDDYYSVNSATYISGTNVNGKIRSSASILGNVDMNNLSWFKYDGSNWTKLDTSIDTSIKTNTKVATANINGEGLYVLMSTEVENNISGVENVSYENIHNSDTSVYINMTDNNASTEMYRIYYSENPIDDVSNVDYQIHRVGSQRPILNLDKTNTKYYIGIETIDKSGAKSPIVYSEVMTKEADSDNDGIPDWYCDKYNLWRNYNNTMPDGYSEEGQRQIINNYIKNISDTSIAADDPDNDGISNLDEFKNGTDPIASDIEDTNIAVLGISLPEEVDLEFGMPHNFSAILNPENPTNNKVIWKIDDESVASVIGETNYCTIDPHRLGRAKVTAITDDGEYIATCYINIVEPKPVTTEPTTNSTTTNVETTTKPTVTTPTKVPPTNPQAQQGHNSSGNTNTTTTVGTTEPTDSTAPKTGDTRNIAAILTAMLGSIGVAFVSKKKRNK